LRVFELIFVHNRTAVIIACLYLHVALLLLGFRGHERDPTAALAQAAPWRLQTGADLLDASVLEPLTREAVLGKAKVSGRPWITKEHVAREANEIGAEDRAPVSNGLLNCWGGPLLLFVATVVVYAFVKRVALHMLREHLQPVPRRRSTSRGGVASMAQGLQEQVLRSPLRATVRAASRAKLQ
jgi:hypothetical protein